jgi:hypothetical protein
VSGTSQWGQFGKREAVCHQTRMCKHVAIGIQARHDRWRTRGFIAVHRRQADHANHFACATRKHWAARVARAHRGVEVNGFARECAHASAVAQRSMNAVARGAATKTNYVELFANAGWVHETRRFRRYTDKLSIEYQYRQIAAAASTAAWRRNNRFCSHFAPGEIVATELYFDKLRGVQ